MLNLIYRQDPNLVTSQMVGNYRTRELYGVELLNSKKLAHNFLKTKSDVVGNQVPE